MNGRLRRVPFKRATSIALTLTLPTYSPATTQGRTPVEESGPARFTCYSTRSSGSNRRASRCADSALIVFGNCEHTRLR
jgi:hypothetical protein